MGLRACLERLRRWFRSPRPLARKAPAPNRTPLRLEQLEARDVPAAGPNDTFLASVYQGFLARPIDQGGLAFWGGQLAATGSRTQVADSILHSPEWHGRELQLLYQELLGRPLDTSGLQFWGNILETGGTYEQVKAGILGSPEYFADNGGTNVSWLTAVYRSQLGRDPGPVGLSFWSGQFALGLSRETIAARILASDEAHTVEMDGIYRNVLSRPLDGVGATFWDAVLSSGTTVDDVLARVVASPEFFNQLNAFLIANPSILSDPNVAANGFLGQFGKFSAVFPGVEQLDRNLLTDSSIRTARVTVGTTASAVNPANVNNVSVGPFTGTNPGFTFTPATTTTGVSPFVGNGGNAASPGFLLTSPAVLAPNPQSVSITGTNPTTSSLGTNSTTAPGNVNSTNATLGVNSTTVSNFAPLSTTLPSPIVVGGPMSFNL